MYIHRHMHRHKRACVCVCERCWINSLWCSWHWCNLNQGDLNLFPRFQPSSCQLETQFTLWLRWKMKCLQFPEITHNVDWAIAVRYQSNISALCRGPRLLSAVCSCHSFHRKMERQEMAGCCETYKAGYSCIGFCSCFQASGLLCGDTAACILVAEEPDCKRKKGQKGNQRLRC